VERRKAWRIDGEERGKEKKRPHFSDLLPSLPNSRPDRRLHHWGITNRAQLFSVLRPIHSISASRARLLRRGCRRTQKNCHGAQAVPVRHAHSHQLRTRLLPKPRHGLATCLTPTRALIMKAAERSQPCSVEQQSGFGVESTFTRHDFPFTQLVLRAQE
jgi:hypothetical protein